MDRSQKSTWVAIETLEPRDSRAQDDVADHLAPMPASVAESPHHEARTLYRSPHKPTPIQPPRCLSHHDGRGAEDDGRQISRDPQPGGTTCSKRNSRARGDWICHRLAQSAAEKSDARQSATATFSSTAKPHSRSWACSGASSLSEGV